MPVKMRVNNCSKYNKFLAKRGNFFDYINNAIPSWYEIGPKIQGGNKIYSDKMVTVVRYIFSLALRQTVGFIEGYLQQIEKDLLAIHRLPGDCLN